MLVTYPYLGYVGVTGKAATEEKHERVVEVQGDTQSGSGYAIHNSKFGAYVLTSRHVITSKYSDAKGRIVRFERAKSISVRLAGETFAVDGRWYSPKPDMPDIALLHTKLRLPYAYGPRLVRSGNFHDLDGWPVRVVGYGSDGRVFGLRSGWFLGSSYYAAAHIMKLAPRHTSEGMAVITKGDSGGPVFDEQSRLVGIVTQGPAKDEPSGWGSAVVIDEWAKGWLGRIGIVLNLA